MSFENAELLQIQEELDKLKEYQILKIETFLKQPFLVHPNLFSYSFFYPITTLTISLGFSDTSFTSVSETPPLVNIKNVLEATKSWPNDMWRLISVVPYNRVCVTRDRIKSEFSMPQNFINEVSIPTPMNINTSFYTEVDNSGRLREEVSTFRYAFRD